MKRILILNTGGTFSSRPTEDGLVPSVSGAEIIRSAGHVSDEIELAAEIIAVSVRLAACRALRAND